MGTLVRQVGDPAEVTPEISSNAHGIESWGGVHVLELTALDLVSMLQFCRSEGWRKGWNDSNQNRVGQDREGPFDADLLGGFPAEEWTRSYDRGVDEQGASKTGSTKF
jgi:hypothetical protein